jgi:hypothetical protein
MAEIRGTLTNERADRLNHLLAECHREVREAESGFDAWDVAEVGKLIDAVKNTVNRHREEKADHG